MENALAAAGAGSLADISSLNLQQALRAFEPCDPKVEARIESLPLKSPFRISDHMFETVEILVVTLSANGQSGQGEAAGVYYLGDMPERMLEQVNDARDWLCERLTPDKLLLHMPAGGARNALDCALWDLQSRLTGKPVWQLLGMAPPRPLLTTFTIGAEAPGTMALAATAYEQARAIKIKLNGDGSDAQRLAAVRAARPDVLLMADANRALTPASLTALSSALHDCSVVLIEQPFAVGADALLDPIDLPCPVAVDESLQRTEDLQALADLYDVINIKLDKCGGLTAGLQLAAEAHRRNLGLMVGNMLGSSLAMAPAYLLGQYCGIVDLDGPLFLDADRPVSVEYREGRIVCDRVWGLS